MAGPMPIFIIKAKDRLAPVAVLDYRMRCIQAGQTEQAAEVEKAVQEIQEWQAANRDKLKFPDHAHVPAGEEEPPPYVVDLLEAFLAQGTLNFKGHDVPLKVQQRLQEALRSGELNGVILG